MEGGPQQAPAGVSSGGAGCGTTTEGSLALSSGGRIQIYPLRMTISSVPLWIIIPQAAADGLSLRSRGHRRLRHRRVTGLVQIALRRATRGEGISAGGLQRHCMTCSSNRHATPEFSLIPSSATKSGWMRPMVSTKLASRSTSLLADGVLWRGPAVPEEQQPASLRRRRRWRGRPAQWNWRPGRCLRIPHPETMSRRLIRSAFSAFHLASCQSRVCHRRPLPAEPPRALHLSNAAPEWQARSLWWRS